MGVQSPRDSECSPCGLPRQALHGVWALISSMAVISFHGSCLSTFSKHFTLYGIQSLYSVLLFLSKES